MPKVMRIDPTTKHELAKMRVCAYCRVSRNTADQLNSYARQIHVYTDLIKRNPLWQMVEIFADEGITGTSADKRPEFQRMIKMCEQKQIDLIITKSISRFARNTMEALEIVRKLKLLGIGVQFEKEGIYTLSLGDEMLLNTFTAIAQEESIAISERIRYIPATVISEKHRRHWDKDTYVIPEYTFGFECKEDIKLSHEHTECVWLTYDEATKKLKWDSNRTALYELHCRLEVK